MLLCCGMVTAIFPSCNLHVTITQPSCNHHVTVMQPPRNHHVTFVSPSRNHHATVMCNLIPPFFQQLLFFIFPLLVFCCCSLFMDSGHTFCKDQRISSFPQLGQFFSGSPQVLFHLKKSETVSELFLFREGFAHIDKSLHVETVLPDGSKAKLYNTEKFSMVRIFFP